MVFTALYICGYGYAVKVLKISVFEPKDNIYKELLVAGMGSPSSKMVILRTVLDKFCTVKMDLVARMVHLFPSTQIRMANLKSFVPASNMNEDLQANMEVF